MSLAVGLPPITVRSLPVADPGSLLSRLPAPDGLAWVHGDDGIVGWGEIARLRVRGPDALERAASWWSELSARMVVEDRVGRTGSGPICFASVAFDRRTADSLFVVPRVILARRDGRSWLTTFGSDRELPAAYDAPGPDTVTYSDGALPASRWGAAVAAAVGRIRGGDVEKVVLARDLIARTTPPVDPRFLLARLARRYPACWTFSVDGLVGATPELLVRRRGRSVTSLVLAGTVRRQSAAEDDALLAGLATSGKDGAEHALSVASVARSLRPFCRALPDPGPPRVLALAGLAHLATEVTGRLAADTPVLSLLDALHPSAAVCGTPADVALDLIPELEGMDRGRYAGPVGWLDAAGDGEFGIALRCAEISGDRLRLFAGCGIVAGSDPDAEIAESETKFDAVRSVLPSPT